MIYSLHGQTIENVMHVEDGAGWTVTKLNNLAALFAAWWNTDLRTHLDNDISLQRIKCTDLTTQTAPTVTYTTGLPLAGTQVGNTLPNNCAAVVTFRTALRGRSYRGRVYIAGMDDANVTNSAIAAAWASAIETDFANLNADLVAAGQEHVVLSRYTNKAARAAGVGTPVVSYEVDGDMDSQRRRLPGRGR